MLAVTLRGIFSHKLRLLLSASAITLGIAFLAGTMVLTDTLRTSVDDLQTTLSGGSDVSVRSGSATGSDVADRAPVPADLLTSLRRVPGVESATGSSRGYAQVLDSHGRLVGAGASVGTSMPPGGLLQVHRGRAPHGTGEVALDVDSADNAHLRVGDRVTLLTAGPPRPAVLVGLVAYGKVTSVARRDPGGARPGGRRPAAGDARAASPPSTSPPRTGSHPSSSVARSRPSCPPACRR